MNAHPLNLAVCFLLEIAILLALGAWGWQRAEGWPRWLLAIGLPLVAAAAWGVFRVPNDPGPAPVAVPGLVRLLFELALFGLAIWALFHMKYYRLGWVMAVVSLAHYLVSYDRVVWLLGE